MRGFINISVSKFKIVSDQPAQKALFVSIKSKECKSFNLIYRNKVVTVFNRMNIRQKLLHHKFF